MNDCNPSLIPYRQLSPAKRALLEMRLRGHVPERTKTQAIPRRPEGTGALLSFAQQRLWFLHQMAPQNAVYSVPAALRLEGVLNLSALEQAFTEIVRRHEILRTTFEVVGGEPVQVISPLHRMTLPIVDLKALGKGEQEARVRELIGEEARRPFDLERGPPVRVCLLELGEVEHVLLATLHHIICDGWSMGILVREIAELYEAFSSARPAPLPELPIQYADFAYWQRQWLQGETLEQQLAYWKRQLADLPVLDFPTDHPRPAVPSFRGASVPLRLPRDLTDRLKALSKDAGVTLFATVLAVFYVLLHRYTGQKDLVTGTGIANRNRPDIEGLIGCFVNALVLRIKLVADPTFRELLGLVDEVLLGAYAHQDMPFDRLVEELKVNRDPTRNPLFQVGLAFNNVPRQPVQLARLEITPVEIATGTAQFDCTVYLSEVAGTLVGSIVYSTDLFAESTVKQLARHFAALLEGVVMKPMARLSELPMLSDREQRQLLVEWQGRKGHYRRNRCLHQLFEAQARQVPEARAVVCGAQRLSYRDLNTKANQLAHYLRARGIGPESLVGVCMGRSVDLVVAILGILKAGGAYVPIDPSYPNERRAYLLADSTARVVLAQAPLMEGLPSVDTEFVCLDRDWEAIAEYPATAPANEITPAHLAYVIYTSGSTGKPKGVKITHANAVHSTWARFDYYQEPVGRFLLLPSFAFDSSVAGIFWTLSQGGCLCLPEEDRQRDPVALAAEIAEKGITHLLCLPSFYQLLLEQDERKLGSLRVVIVAGEACLAGLVRRHYEALPQVTLFNEYGPTEGTVWTSVSRLQAEDAQNTIPIGRPINNVESYLLDAFLNAIPIGVSGEIYIGGAGLARGYLNRPDQTAGRFIPHPFGQEGSRLYRTGDLARFRADGNIEFLGRIDHQVKIRGFRVEVGEIEATLLEHPQVQEAVVIAREDVPGDKRLAAYCVLSPLREENEGRIAGPLNGDGLRDFMTKSLPDYMVPSALVLLDSLPLTANGKVDRKALLARDLSQPSAHQYAVPRNPTEEVLAQIWSETLGVERVGIHDNFFQLGGHSILAVQLVMKVNDAFHLDLEIAVVFERPTVAMLAELIDQGEALNSEHDANYVGLGAEAHLDPAIWPAGNWLPLQSDPAEIFLTGATGFLGAFLLHELLQQTSANIHCLVRAETYAEAFDKLRCALERYGIYDSDLVRRVLPVPGDLSSAGFGLTTALFQSLAERVEVIYHNGAQVNFVQPYAALKAANVLGTQEILRLACTRKVKPVHYVSTLSVFGTESPPSPHGFSEDDFPGPSADLGNGYGQSKWVAEQLVRIAASRGLPVSVYRPATVTGHSRTGAWNSDDFLCRLIRGCIAIGAAPAEPVHFDIVPVDYVSRAIVYLSRTPDAIGGTFHLNNKCLVSSTALLDWIKSFGYSVGQQSYLEWREKVMEVAEQSSHHPLYPLLPMFRANTPRGDSPSDLRERYNCSRTLEALMDSGIRCPVPDRALLEAYLSYLQRTGSLAPSA
ncbi:MAG: non-ribosomal peptide synthetase family protein [Gammaproteobacteria bacterium]